MTTIVFKKAPELTSYTAPQLERSGNPVKLFDPVGKRLTKQGMVMRRSDHVLIELKSQHEENGYR